MSSVLNKRAALASFAALLGAIAVPGLAEAKNTASQTFRITARVPVACWVRPDRTVQAGEGMTGNVVEACNNPGGYTVTAQYRPLMEGESARMIYGDRSLELSPTGGQELRRSNMATIRSVAYRFDNVSVETPLTLSLTIQPL
ncbi:hypothetical protein OB03_00020 [Brevundimonas sp. GN22]|uniref:hypothetical protein n=1 Tax=Brevundimonas pishanensis TaxID=2896315 RepID=UPI001FA7E724|nr:hypothetical protein [Brevundimonas pishanensis]